MSFQLATTMYEHYYQREPVNFFIMFIYLTTTTYACYWPSAAVYIFSLCVPASRNHVWMHYSGGSVSFFIVLPAGHDHVWMLLFKRSILYFYYVFPASQDHVWTFLSKMSGLFFFNYVLLSREDHVWTLLSNWWSLNMFITWFQLAMYECYCRFLLCVSS